jgi:hypothetical protein
MRFYALKCIFFWEKPFKNDEYIAARVQNINIFPRKCKTYIYKDLGISESQA